jgi:phosphonopyruvate decarboxylase
MIPAFEAVKAINRLRADAVAVATMTPNRYWEAVSERPELDLPIFGAMGKASSVALGLAIARPDKKVLVLDGDGALLMNLGTLVTIAGQQPRNLVHFVFEDGMYQTTGGQPVPGAGVFDLAGMARSAGFKESFAFDDLEDFASELPGILEMEGPVFVSLKVFHTDDMPAFYMGDTGAAIRRLSKALREG